MNLPATTTDNITELLIKIIEFTQTRQKILTRNINNIDSFGFEPKDLEVDEFSELLHNAINEHNTEVNFDTVLSKWQHFIDEVSGEKGLTLGPAIKSLQVQSLSGNKLSVFSDDAEIEKTIELNNKYLEIKSETIFGKRLLFQISNQFDASKQTINLSTPISKETTNEKQEKFDDPYEEIIINELGGIKIN